jgi:hypothetical protein
MENNYHKVFLQFQILKSAVIDASSIIYMRKAGFLNDLAAEIRLLSPTPVINETGYLDLPIKPIERVNSAQSNDQLLVAYSLSHQIPVISEDKKILMRIKRAHRPYFNSLMMLNFLLFRKKISAGNHRVYFRRLIDFAWYSPAVLAYSKTIFMAMNDGRDCM